MPAQTVIKLRRDSAADWASVNPVLADGEVGLESDSGLVKYGNGTAEWADLAYTTAASVKTKVQNATGSSIPKGSVVYISGANGDNPLITLADADAEMTSSKTLGITESAIANGAQGYVIESGLLTGLNTSAATAGDSVWLSSTAGGFVFGAPPAKPAHSVYLGVVTRVNTNTGTILVKVQNGYELNELHDVNAGSPTANDVLQWNGTAWVNADVVSQVTAAIVDSAPATLDTLNELAAALGDDPNFATTVTTALGNKQDKVSGVSDTEIGYLDGVTSAIQTQINGKANTSHTHVLADITDVTATATELNYIDGVTSGIQTQLDGKAALSHTHNASAITYTIEDKTANYTIVAADEGKVIRSTGSAITVTVADVFAIGEVVTFTQYGAGQITFAPNGGVTLHSVDTKRKTNKQYSTVQIMKVAAATYLLFGDIAA